ncbi:MAG TPA: tetratricopeptide repeat protein [Kofleriaceae bacterium]|nr:tetratricopeptide repeat protein [Kofleriaceae bacterium]
MRTQLMIALAGLCTVTPAAAGKRQMPDELHGPILEVVTHAAKVELPAVPVFALAARQNGYHTPLELRQRGRPWLGLELLVKGFVTSIYDCVADLSARQPGSSRNDVIRLIEHDPTVCEQPKFYLGQVPQAPRSLSITVVDVPRPPREVERLKMKPTDAMSWPEVPTLTLRDYVAVTGQWAIVSRHGERDSNGLLIYRKLAHEAPSPAALAAPSTALTTVEPAVSVVTARPLRTLISNEHWNASVDHLNTCTHALTAQDYALAIRECEAAIHVWGDNHLAWYGLASAHLAQQEWTAALAPARRAVELRPDIAMYQMYYGIALTRSARMERAASVFRLPTIDAAPLQLAAASDALRRAVTIAPGLWRAHYYLAGLEIDAGEAALAARQLQQAIVGNPRYAPSYVALAELYLRWGFRDRALAVVEAGTRRLTPRDASTLWFELATIYEADRRRDEAVQAYSRVVAMVPGDGRAHYLRGRLYAGMGKNDEAKADLQIVVNTRDPELQVEQQIARQLLWKIANPIVH